MPDMEKETTFFIGDSDLYLLGVAAALAARWHGFRKKYNAGWLAGYPQDDQDALRRVRDGLEAGAALSLDDVPEVRVSIHMEAAVLDRLRQLDPHLGEGDDEEGEEEEEDEEEDEEEF